eukprot:TRINITY_DN1889_c0_g1_i8.p1 TRINITY_DN1889_c0_g1~~TRINITY_DN1889_c0_g1_i8.p1  ORF type:complete len:209 (+),score=67.66 TRINITY_DN1889_c0_g1_i8:240-866(+)
MLTQLVQHERIRTTHTKAKFLRQHMEKLLTIAKDAEGSIPAQRRIQGILTTEFARKKLILEIAPRMKEVKSHRTRIVRLGTRKGDGAPVSYIELVGNEIEKYEKALAKQERETSTRPDRKEWEKKIFGEEKEVFLTKLKQAKDDLKRLTSEDEALVLSGHLTKEEAERRKVINFQPVKFFQAKLKQVEHDLFILNKDRYDPIKFVPLN